MDLQLHWFFPVENTFFCKWIWVNSGCSVRLNYLWVRRRRENQEELREGGKKKPKHAPVSSKHSPSPGHVPSLGRRVCSPGKMAWIHQLIKFTAWHNWQTSLREVEERKIFHPEGEFLYLVEKVLVAFGGQLLSLPSPASPWCFPSQHHKNSRFWVDFLCFLQACDSQGNDLLPLKWLGLTSGRKIKFYKCESSVSASAFYKSLDISQRKWLQ